ncbi:ABC transporter ATP-binding protein [Mesorhizobium japonicum]|uniref:ABC transporter, ATP-binding protein n=1 Tax=Mesorhizobium japonicum (strain LMG 29417 / CECT 9101 / MAFF 303099) TaxID=266835 RepID=Q981Q9_RHILO|nr:ABC transporter ATP-binding protein [Mesorhizobium japonicum]BAB54650.1 ABC transporter, ATP-binding protein [Mesorhizobium japonicum MAFF 303099]
MLNAFSTNSADAALFASQDVVDHRKRPVLTVNDLTVSFSGVPVLHGVDLTVDKGEAIGIVGESGCGKSVTWRAVLGLLPKSAEVKGEARLDGFNLAGASQSSLDKVRGGRIAMIFQDPASALNPVHRVGAQITEALRLHRGLTGAAARAEAQRLLDLVGIPDATSRLNAYPHELSGGQNQRVMIAIALAGEPELLVADEPTTALDATVQAQILLLLKTIQRDTGMALVMISHDLAAVAAICDRVCVMYAGRIIEAAPTHTLLNRPEHPYTRDLIGAIPPSDGPRVRLTAIPGAPPHGGVSAGCAYAPRCRSADAACGMTRPDMRTISARHVVRCLRVAEGMCQ